MSTAAVVSVAGAPGVTTLVCAAAAAAADRRPLLVVEASTSGSAIAARWRLDVRDTVMTTARLAMDVSDTVDLWKAAHHPWLAASRVIPAHPSAAVTRQAQVGRWLADRLVSARGPILIDAGRLDGSAEQFELLTAVDSVWVLVDPTAAQVIVTRAVAEWLNRTGPVELLVRERSGEPARNSSGAVAHALAWPLLASVPYDSHAARALCGFAPSRRNLSRAPLLRTGKELAGHLTPAEVRA